MQVHPNPHCKHTAALHEETLKIVATCGGACHGAVVRPFASAIMEAGRDFLNDSIRGRADRRKGERPVALKSLSGSAKPQVMAVLPPMKTWAFPQVSAYPLTLQMRRSSRTGRECRAPCPTSSASSTTPSNSTTPEPA